MTGHENAHLEIGAGVVRIAVVAAGHVVARLVVAAGIDPAAQAVLSVVAQRREAGNLLAFCRINLGRIVRIRYVFVQRSR